MPQVSGIKMSHFLMPLANYSFTQRFAKPNKIISKNEISRYTIYFFSLCNLFRTSTTSLLRSSSCSGVYALHLAWSDLFH